MDNPPLLPDVSVIIATFNVENYIERALKSALNQQGVSVEIILIDDASTDRTVAKATSLNDSRIKIVQRADNSGPSLTRNEGLAAAKAPWIAILDGDDAFAPHRLQNCLRRAESFKADIVIDNLEIHNETNGAQHPMFRPKYFGSKSLLELATFIKGNTAFLGGTSLGYVKPVFSNAFLRQNNLRYDPDIRIGEDYMLLAECLAKGAVCAIEPSAGYRYTVRAGSMSHRILPADITRIQTGDQRFLSRYTLSSEALAAQHLRDTRLQDAYAYVQLVDALKSKQLGSILRIFSAHPLSAFHLWRPVWSRIKKLPR